MVPEYNGEPNGSSAAGNRSLADRLVQKPPLILDGAMGTELERRGVPAELPLWSSRALIENPEAIAQIHREYADAGADLLTANTFRTQGRTLRKAQTRQTPEELTHQAVEIARVVAAQSTRPIWIAASAPPLEDCYRPDLVPERSALEDEHAEHIGYLRDAGVDLILIETMNSIREAEVAAMAAASSGIQFFVSFVCEAGGRLLSGETLAEAVEVATSHGAVGVLVNCLSVRHVPECLEILELGCQGLASSQGRPTRFGAYPNLGAPAGSGWSEPLSPEEFAQYGSLWASRGASILGGCCGTTPDHVRSLARQVG